MDYKVVNFKILTIMEFNFDYLKIMIILIYNVKNYPIQFMLVDYGIN